MSFPAGSGNIHEQIQVSLYNVERVCYKTLNLTEVLRPHWILSHVVSGHVKTSTENETFVVTQGDVMIHPPRLPFSEVAKEEGVHDWIQFETTIFPNMDIFSVYPVSMVVTLQSQKKYLQTFQKLQSLWKHSNSPLRNFTLSALTFQLHNMVLTSWEEAGSIRRSTTKRDRFYTLIRYMNEHMHEKITREHLASMIHLHPVYLDRVFHGIYGMPPMQMLKELRLSRIKQYLENTDESLASIAAACGLGDAAYLSRLFHKSFSQTPGEYRRMVKQAKENIYSGARK